jgi:uncharacterized protein
MMTERTIMECVMGSKAYGLDTPESDTDMRSVFVASTWDMLSLRKPKDTIQKNNPDSCAQEVEKFINLALANNPTILEMLFVPDYTILTSEGELLVENRNLFLSKRIYNTFGGYAIQQMKRMERRGDGSFSSDTRKRTAKHARHTFRLIQQGAELLETGNLTVRVKNREELFALGEMTPEELQAKFEAAMVVFNKTKTSLPQFPDIKAVNEILLQIRRNDILRGAIRAEHGMADE